MYTQPYENVSKKNHLKLSNKIYILNSYLYKNAFRISHSSFLYIY